MSFQAFFGVLPVFGHKKTRPDALHAPRRAESFLKSPKGLICLCIALPKPRSSGPHSSHRRRARPDPRPPAPPGSCWRKFSKHLINLILCDIILALLFFCKTIKILFCCLSCFILFFSSKNYSSFFSHRIHTSYSYKLYSYLFFYIFLKRLSGNIFCPYTASKHIFILFLSI